MLLSSIEANLKFCHEEHVLYSSVQKEKINSTYYLNIIKVNGCK